VRDEYEMSAARTMRASKMSVKRYADGGPSATRRKAQMSVCTHPLGGFVGGWNPMVT